MQCKKCKIDMHLDRVEGSVFYIKCKKCGSVITKTKEELMEEHNKANESTTEE